ncbi:universal stress protein [Priestia endophytica]|uniref:universal stress protein n=1 Tax=Priestia endophytica TaxID=135735 RepID=UPI002281F76D|nr:universal stress protein [Priestia endophytica]MCY8233722.1 universal stress protein [Priestia endophytica]
MYNKILAAVDGSKQAKEALGKAFSIASCYRTPLQILHVKEGDDKTKTYWYKRSNLNKLEDRQEFLREIDTMAAKYNITHKVHFRVGNPAEEIIRHANENNIELIVVGSRGFNRFQKVVLGSVSSRIIEKASCSVLLVK